MLVKLFLAGSLLLLTACASVEPLALRDPQVNLVWPSPPDTPRIQFLTTIAGPENIVPPHGKIRKYFDYFTGESDPGIKLDMPFAISGDGESVIYIADTGTGIVHRYDLNSREVGYLFKAGEDYFASPVGIAVDTAKKVYISDSVNGKVYVFNGKGEFLHELKADKAFGRPAGIAVNSRDYKYVVDVLAHNLYVFDKDDRYKGTFLREDAGRQLSYPSNVAIDSHDNVYITDSMNFTIKAFSIDGKSLRNIGQIGDSPGFFARPKGITFDKEDHLYVVDASQDNLQIFNEEGKLLLYLGRNGFRPGEFYLPNGIFIDKKNRIFVADTYNSRVQVFQYLKEDVRQ